MGGLKRCFLFCFWRRAVAAPLGALRQFAALGSLKTSAASFSEAKTAFQKAVSGCLWGFRLLLPPILFIIFQRVKLGFHGGVFAGELFHG